MGLLIQCYQHTLTLLIVMALRTQCLIVLFSMEEVAQYVALEMMRELSVKVYFCMTNYNNICHQILM